jgi:hypothetical protein
MLNVTSDAVFMRTAATAVVKALAAEPTLTQPAPSSYA